MTAALRRVRCALGTLDDRGNAIVEFVFVAVLILVPLVYLVAAVATVQRSDLAVSQAARNAGRAFATSDAGADAEARVDASVRLAMADQKLPNNARLHFVAAGANCDGPSISPRLEPGAQFTVCVTRRTRLPGVPSLLSGHAITITGSYLVHVDDYRQAGP